VALPPGFRLGRYEIVAQIGAGGMGEVYRARDPKLNRTVAIKVLLETTAANPEARARFEHEAQSVAALNHPNIVTIHSVEEAAGVVFLTMEYVEGKPLSEMLVKGGLPLTQILALAIPLADAVAAAHDRGITHRDLKPANVMVTPDGRPKVLDFGLAKLIKAIPLEQGMTELATMGVVTGEGRIVGTVAYMSPEQAQGISIDHRSDLFSLGVILFELATGDRPFTGDTTVSVISSIVKDTPRSVTDLRPNLPPDLSRIIKRCLIKDPERRYQTAKDLRNELEELKETQESADFRAAR
jgi:serine/threonine protein kinase